MRDLFKSLGAKAVASRAKLILAMLRHPKTGCIVKCIIVAGAAYVLSPIDFSITILDDALVIWLIAWLLPEFMPAEFINPLKVEAGIND